MNFNDFYGSIMTLCCILVSNNWNSFVDLYTGEVGYNWWPRLYFCFFFFLVALVIMNIIISFVLEIYDSLGGDVTKEIKKEKNAMKLAKEYPNGGDQLKKLLKQVREDEEREREAEEENSMN